MRRLDERAREFKRRHGVPLQSGEDPDTPWVHGTIYNDLMIAHTQRRIGARGQLESENETDMYLRQDWNRLTENSVEYLRAVSFRNYHPEFHRLLEKTVQDELYIDSPRVPITYDQRGYPICVTQPLLNEFRQNRFFMNALNSVEARHFETLKGSYPSVDVYNSRELYCLLTKNPMRSQAAALIFALKEPDKIYLSVGQILKLLSPTPLLAPAADLFMASREAVIKRPGLPYLSLEYRALAIGPRGLSPCTVAYLENMVIPPLYLVLFSATEYPDEITSPSGVVYKMDFMSCSAQYSTGSGHAFCCVRKNTSWPAVWVQVDNTKTEEIELGKFTDFWNRNPIAYHITTVVYKAVANYNPVKAARESAVVKSMVSRLTTDLSREATLIVDLTYYSAQQISELVDECLDRGTALMVKDRPSDLLEDLLRRLEIVSTPYVTK